MLIRVECSVVLQHEWVFLFQWAIKPMHNCTLNDFLCFKSRESMHASSCYMQFEVRLLLQILRCYVMMVRFSCVTEKRSAESICWRSFLTDVRNTTCSNTVKSVTNWNWIDSRTVSNLKCQYTLQNFVVMITYDIIIQICLIEVMF